MFYTFFPIHRLLAKSSHIVLITIGKHRYSKSDWLSSGICPESPCFWVSHRLARNSIFGVSAWWTSVDRFAYHRTCHPIDEHLVRSTCSHKKNWSASSNFYPPKPNFGFGPIQYRNRILHSASINCIPHITAILFRWSESTWNLQGLHSEAQVQLNILN